MKQFLKTYFICFFGLLLLAASIFPFIMWLVGEWHFWTLFSYFFTIPADVAFIEYLF